MITFSEQHLNNIKELLFGQQKQASVINDAVVKMVARELSATFGINDTSSLDDAHAKIMSYLFAVVGNGVTYNEDALMLIVGEQSLANLKSGEIVSVYESDASDTSTKKIYRINTQNQATVDNTGEAGNKSTYEALPGNVIEDARDWYPESYQKEQKKLDPNADFWLKAQQLRDAILPLVPDAVKTEIPNNEFAQALVCAEQYFSYRN